MSFVKSLLKVIILMAGLGSHAVNSEEWTHIQGESDRETVYYDSDSIEVGDGGLFVWTMIDFSAQQMGVLSRKNFIQINCAHRRYQTLVQILYEGPFGSGASYKTDIVSGGMASASSNSVISGVMNKLCG
ncbi:MAG: hypothetical protein O3B03_06265 [Proteobacteria bacterium]|nr:hypothetical protein [Pseudomonadota bacterium]MDA1331874.1 hypothetical protein [Pseudomonadota bacterium]